jgi:hypothetical protein
VLGALPCSQITQYCTSVADVRRDLLIPEDRTRQSRRGTSEAHTLQAGRVQRPGAARTLKMSILAPSMVAM